MVDKLTSHYQHLKLCSPICIQRIHKPLYHPHKASTEILNLTKPGYIVQLYTDVLESVAKTPSWINTDKS